MNAESGGNPMAINNWDSNAAMGQASRGLMQVIPSTFAAYRDPSLSNNIFDPMANMVAAARYIKARYGGNVPGSPYRTGTNNARRGWHLVGENGPEMRWFSGGERVANARQTQRNLRRVDNGGVVFERGCFQIDARGATREAVHEMEHNLLPKLRMAVKAGTGKR
jgi:SLT domain-containing protein